MTGGEIELRDYGTREAWLAGRLSGLGASDVAALFTDEDGDSLGYSTAYALWLEKTGQVAPEDLSGDLVDLGNKFEPVIAELYQERTGRTVVQYGPFCVAQHPTISFLRATPDRWVTRAPDRSGRGLAQIKKSNRFVAHNWDDGPPLPIQIQVQSEMAVTGYDWDSVPVIFDLVRFRTTDVERDADFIGEIEDRVRAFWDLVQRWRAGDGTAVPPVDGSPKTLDAIKRLHPRDNGETVRLPEEAVAWADELVEAKAIATTAAKMKTAAENKMRAAIGAATFGELPDGRRFSLKTTEKLGGTRIVKPSTYRTLRLVGAKQEE